MMKSKAANHLFDTNGKSNKGMFKATTIVGP